MAVQDYNPTRDIYFFSNNGNPTITSPNSPYEISLGQTRESMQDPEVYEAFVKNAISNFRHSETYTNYKGFLMSEGLDHCQIHGNITSEMAPIEMHHNILTIFDIAVIITQHLLNTMPYVTTFDVVMMLKREHTRNHIPVIMMTETPHQEYHDDSGFWIDPHQCFSLWGFFEFLKEFYTGITKGIAYKIVHYMDSANYNDTTTDNGLLEIREQIINWSIYNDNTYYKGDPAL